MYWCGWRAETPVVTVNFCQLAYVVDRACQAQSRANIQDGLDEGFYVGIVLPFCRLIIPDLGP